MSVLGAGDKLLQLAYVCRLDRFDAALEVWRSTLGVGPLWIADARPAHQTYRGRATDAAVRLAMTWRDGIQIELLAPLDDRPSAWSDWVEPPGGVPAGGLFHHVLIEADDYDATVGRLLGAGASDGWTGVLADGRRVAYVDARPVLGHFVEVIEPGGDAVAVRERMRTICATWDGRRPRRDYAELRSDG